MMRIAILANLITYSIVVSQPIFYLLALAKIANHLVLPPLGSASSA